MPVSRIPFALGDLVKEVKMLGNAEREGFRCDIHLDHETHAAVVGELENHHSGAKLQRDAHYRGYGTAVRYAGVRLVCVPPGNRDG